MAEMDVKTEQQQSKAKDWERVKFLDATDRAEIEAYARRKSMTLGEFLRMAARSYMDRAKGSKG